jgi:hypothetical protein
MMHFRSHLSDARLSPERLLCSSRCRWCRAAGHHEDILAWVDDFGFTADFLAAIADELEGWQVAIVEAEPGDLAERRVVFWLASDPERRAYVAHEYGRLIVTLRDSYHFDLDRLHEYAPKGWSWPQQVQGKRWCQDEHLDLLLTLEALFPYQPKPTA